MKIGLALGGGGARALAHIGVLRFLEEKHIKIDYISGTSMGAVIGGLYSLNPRIDFVEKQLRKEISKHRKDLSSLKAYEVHSSVEEKKMFLEKSFRFVKDIYLWNLRIAKPYLVSPRPFFKIFKKLFVNYRFKDCQIPFMCTAVDIIAGKALAIRSGSMFRGIVSSCALPGVFPPLNTKHGLLVDGGVLVPLPTGYLKDRANLVIGSSVESSMRSPESIRNSVDVLFIVDRLRYNKIVEDNKKESDFIFSPAVAGYSWNDFDNINEIINAGYKEAKFKEDSLMSLIRRMRWLSLLKIKIRYPRTSS